MTLRLTRLMRRRTTLSPALMWAGMLFACVAWLIHISPFVATLWDEHVHDTQQAQVSHHLSVELRPIISAIEQYGRIRSDIAQTNRAAPYDSAAYQLYAGHATTPRSPRIADVDPALIDLTVTPAVSPSLQHQAAQTAKSGTQYSSANLSESAALLPIIIKWLKLTFIAPDMVSIPRRSDDISACIANFFQPLSRAPPALL